ncbi:MAG: acetylglutamate kinase [Actinomycetota bacterium]|nr:acetylglutamate kinase [Actinomycetota bacterium]
MNAEIAGDAISQADAAAKAAVLIESLPWLKRFAGKIIVVKFGGNAMVDDDLKRAFAEDMVYLRHAGIRPVVVHGGGPQISAALKERGIASEFRGGLRVTTPEVMTVVKDVLTTQVNTELVDLINTHGEFGVGLSGESGDLFGGRRRGTVIDGEEVDLGLVGDVVEVDPSVVLELLDDGMIPVVSSVAPDLDEPGRFLNVNADSAAASLAVALGAAKLVILTDVAGLYIDDEVVEAIGVGDARRMIAEGAFDGGIVPKLRAAAIAAGRGVSAHIGRTAVVA